MICRDSGGEGYSSLLTSAQQGGGGLFDATRSQKRNVGYSTEGERQGQVRSGTRHETRHGKKVLKQRVKQSARGSCSSAAYSPVMGVGGRGIGWLGWFRVRFGWLGDSMIVYYYAVQRVCVCLFVRFACIDAGLDGG